MMYGVMSVFIPFMMTWRLDDWLQCSDREQLRGIVQHPVSWHTRPVVRL